MTQDFFQTACEHGIKIFLSKIISLISKKKKKKMIVHDKKNHLKLEEKEREYLFSARRTATYGYHNMVQPSILPVTVALLPLWNP